MNKLAITAALATAGTAIALTALPASGHRAQGPRTIVLTGTPRPADQKTIDLRPRGESVGDRMLSSETLRRHGVPVTREEGECVLLDRTYEGAQCTLTIMFHDGVLIGQGASVSKRIPGIGSTDGRFAIVGGTGPSTAAAGSVSVRSTRSGHRGHAATRELATPGVQSRLRHAARMVTIPLDGAHVPAILAAFDLGRWGRLSDGPVASGRLGSIWRLDTERGRWALKQVGDIPDEELAELVEGAAFQEAALAAGVPTPAVRRTRAGELTADCGGVRVRLHAWMDLHDADASLDPVDIGRLVAGLHRVEFMGTIGLDSWYTEPVGAARWSELVSALRARHAPFADELEALVPELVAMETYLGSPPRELRTCHRDLWADNVRRTRDGGLCVFDFDNAGLADPSQELAVILVEYCAADPRRTGVVRAAYAEAGGSGRVEDPTAFAMAIAQLSHIVAEGCRRWLAAKTDAERHDNEGWVREFIDQPLTRDLIEALLAD
jgi:Phosphotransferase enzyme family